MRRIMKRQLAPVAGFVGGLSVLVAAGCGTAVTRPAATPVSPPPAATVNAFLSAFLNGHASQAAQLTTEGPQAHGPLAKDQGNLRGLLVNAPPFTPLSALHWTTHCSGLTCSVTFATFNTHRVPTLHLHLRAVGHHARVSLSDLAPWFTAIGHID
jgi:hypothetical protein